MFKLEIHAASHDELVEKVLTLAARLAGNAATALPADAGKASSGSATDAPKASRGTKASSHKGADKGSSDGSAAEPSSEDQKPPANDEPKLTYDTDVKPLVIKLSKLDRDTAAEIISSYKNAETGKAAIKASEIASDLWPELVGKLNEAISTAEMAA